VAFHGLRGQHHRGGDPLVGPALRHVPQDIPLAVGELSDELDVAAAAEQPLHHLGVEHEFPGRDPVQVPDQRVHVVHPVLQQVAEAAVVLLEDPGRGGHLDVRGQQQDTKIRVGLLQLRGGLQSLVGVRGRHPDVHDHYIGPVRGDPHGGLVRGRGLRADLDSRRGEQASQPLTE
jgi:hypothetical protein